MIKLPRGVAERTAALPDELADHLLRVRKLARKLAKRHGVDRDEAVRAWYAMCLPRSRPSHESRRLAGGFAAPQAARLELPTSIRPMEGVRGIVSPSADLSAA